MNLLLDTHVLIWALENNPTLSDKAVSSITRAENMIYVSSVSIWEIGIKKAAGKLDVPGNLTEEINLHRFSPLHITFEHAELAAQLPPIHKDPFDRMLIAQAITEKLRLVTRDTVITTYAVDTLTA
jgi:PIN domain nuclease of toxin-antitoxin system